MGRSIRRKYIIWALGLWSLLVLGGFVILWDYSNNPGAPGEAPLQWPEISALSFDSTSPNLVMFAHPRCPCTRASLEELEKIVAKSNQQINLNIVFYHPEKFPQKWVKTSLYHRAERILRAKLSIDTRQQEIHNFRPQTSGQVYLYSQSGKLIYSGGITGSRGHEGDNVGSRTILTWINDGTLLQEKAFVFGCSLFHEGKDFHDDFEMKNELIAPASAMEQ